MKKTFLHKIREGKLDQWKQWCTFLMEHKAEAQESLQRENATREYDVLFRVGDECYSFGMIEYFDDPMPSDMSSELNAEHRKQVEECLEFVSKGEVLYDI